MGLRNLPSWTGNTPSSTLPTKPDLPDPSRVPTLWFFKSLPLSEGGRFLLTLFDTFILITPAGMMLMLIWSHGTQWNKVGWYEVFESLGAVMVTVCINGVMRWHDNEKLLRTLKSN
jgi:hypothetical protein